MKKSFNTKIGSAGTKSRSNINKLNKSRGYTDKSEYSTDKSYSKHQKNHHGRKNVKQYTGLRGPDTKSHKFLEKKEKLPIEFEKLDKIDKTGYFASKKNEKVAYSTQNQKAKDYLKARLKESTDRVMNKRNKVSKSNEQSTSIAKPKTSKGKKISNPLARKKSPLRNDKESYFDKAMKRASNTRDYTSGKDDKPWRTPAMSKPKEKKSPQRGKSKDTKRAKKVTEAPPVRVSEQLEAHRSSFNYVIEDLENDPQIHKIQKIPVDDFTVRNASPKIKAKEHKEPKEQTEVKTQP